MNGTASASAVLLVSVSLASSHRQFTILRVCPRENQADGGTVEITDFAHISPIVAL